MNFHGVALVFICALYSLNTFAQSFSMDKLNLLLYQDPSAAEQHIYQMEQAWRNLTVSPTERLRLDLLKCETLLQLGENNAALELAQKSIETAAVINPEAQPYFLGCQADAYASFGDLTKALPLLDTAINMAEQFQQPQALTNLLQLRGQLDTENENYLSAMEDLRLALDIYDNIHHQEHNWSWPPLAYLYAAMGNLLYASGDLQQGIDYAYRGLRQPETIKRVRHILLLNTARMTLDNGELDTSNQLLQEARSLLPTQSSPLEKAYSHGIMASIEIDKKNYDVAENLLRSALITFEKQNKEVAMMQVKRLQAIIKFARGNDDDALTLLEQAIEAGEKLEQFGYLELFYQMLSHYYAGNNQHQIAYEYLKKSFTAARKANQHINNIRFIQFKARLSRQASEQAIKQSSPRLSAAYLYFPNNWLVLMLLLGMIIPAAFLWYLVRKVNDKYKSKPLAHSGEYTYKQAIEDAMLNAKQHSRPFNLLVVDTGAIHKIDGFRIENQIKQSLREQDSVFHYCKASILVLLPFTSPKGAKRVMEQLESVLNPWQEKTTIKIGFANMQHFDTAKSMIKRAIANQVCHYKASEIKLSAQSAR